MASDFPGALDDLPNPTSSTLRDASGDLGHAAQHANANDAIEAIQATLGIDPQGSYTDVAERLDLLPDPAGGSDGDVVTVDSGAYILTAGGGGGGGGLVLVDSGTFSAQSTINIDSVFDGTYDDYRIIISNTASGDVQLSLRLRASSTDATTDYGSFRTFTYSGGLAAQANNTGTDEWQVSNCGSSIRCSTALDIIGPALAGEKTTFHGLSQGYFTSTGQIVTQAIGVHDVAAAYDGLSIRCDTNNITGRYAIYGYPK